MSPRSHARLTRYAGLAVVHLVVVVAALSGALGAGSAGLLILLASVPFLFAWGAFQADVATNPALDEVERGRWRIALWVVPWAMTLYWLRYVRDARPDV
jgi:hypothetical protein